MLALLSFQCGSLRRRALAVLALLLVASPVAVAQVRVEFDAPYLAACEEMAAPELSPPLTGEKWVAVRLEVSSLVSSGDERDLLYTLVQLSAPQRTALVQDWFPKSVQAANITGGITTQRRREATQEIGFDLSGAQQPLSGAFHTGLGQKEFSEERYERLPPLETVLASGPTERGAGAFFKFRAGDRQRLEGSHEITLQLRVPQAWRGDYLSLRCTAFAKNRGLVRGLESAEVEAGARRFLIPLYLAGDAEARRTAENFSRSEAQLRLDVRQQAEAIAQRSYPSVIHKLGVWPDARPEIPHDWLSRLLYDPPPPTLRDLTAQIPDRLPTTVRRSAVDFVTAREALRRLTGWGA